MSTSDNPALGDKPTKPANFAGISTNALRDIVLSSDHSKETKEEALDILIYRAKAYGACGGI